MYRKVMVGLDGSPCAAQALQEGMQMAQAGAELLVVTVAPQQVSHLPTGRARAADVELEQARERLEQARAQLARHDVEADLLLIDMTEKPDGNVAKEIAAEAGDSAVDLVILGTHGRSGFHRLLLGSVAESVSRLAPCPVLLVRDHEPAGFGCTRPVEIYGMWPEDGASRPGS